MQQDLFTTETFEPELTVLSHGMGQDSSAILLKLIHDPEFRAQYAPNRLLVLHADTGNEFDRTVKHRDVTQALCDQHDIEHTPAQPRVL